MQVHDHSYTPEYVIHVLWLAVAREKILASHTIKTLQASHAVSVWTVDRGRCASQANRDRAREGVSDMCGAACYLRNSWVSGRLRVAIVGGARRVHRAGSLRNGDAALWDEDGREHVIDQGRNRTQLDGAYVNRTECVDCK
jgi:hypothetical protein